MKKYLRALLCICSCVILNSSFALAAEDNQPEYMIPDAVLSNSADIDEVVALAPEIVRYANLFEEENVNASESDIDFTRAYCVYVDADIFADLPLTRQKLEKLMQSAPKVWVVPVHADGKTVKVQISKGPELSQVDLTDISMEEQQGIETRAGKWQVVASTCYEEDMDYGRQIREVMELQGKSAEETQCILFGGVPGIQSVLAVLLEEDAATGIVSLQRDILVEGNSRDREGGEDTILQQNMVYSVEKYAKGAEMLRKTTGDLADNTAGTAEIKRKGISDTGILIAAGFTVVLVVCIWFGVKRYKKSKM